MFRFIAASKADIWVSKACRLFDVSQSGFYAWKNRSASWRQRQDMILLAHIRNAFALSNEIYASPRMTADLNEEGFAVGWRRVARLMRLNGLQARRKRPFKRTTDSHHAWPIANNVIDRNFAADGPDENGPSISVMSGRPKDGSTSQS